MSIKVCKCPQCRAVKNKRKNRKSKKTIRRYLKRAEKGAVRRGEHKIFFWYWA